MEKNEIIQQVIDQVRRDIMSDKKFLSEVLKKVPITMENLDENLILQLMNDSSKQPPRPKSNRPHDPNQNKDGSMVPAKPIEMLPESIVSYAVSDLLEGNNVYLQGKAGTGKTYMAEAIAQTVLRQKYYLINCSQWTSPIEIRGGQTIKGYQEGLLVKAWAEGAILILDELPKLDPNTAGLLNAALAETAKQPLYDSNGKVIPGTIPTIVNGRGEKIAKGQGVYNAGTNQWEQIDEEVRFRFGVIATGNTDMMNVGNKYSGNNRQDYSLVDRFAGSFYYLEQNPTQEKKLTYPYVFRVCNTMRMFLDKRDALQSVSLRTMLNFNRTYEQEMLYKIGSPYADEIFDNMGERIPPKSMADSVGSFLKMLEKNMMEALQEDPDFRMALDSKPTDSEFIKAFENHYRLNPLKK